MNFCETPFSQMFNRVNNSHFLRFAVGINEHKVYTKHLARNWCFSNHCSYYYSFFVAWIAFRMFRAKKKKKKVFRVKRSEVS